MFKSLFAKKKPVRKLESAADLQIGDLFTLSDRLYLPESLRGVTCEVINIGAYEFSTGYETEFSLKTQQGDNYTLSLSDDDGELALCFCQKIPKNTVLQLFSEEDIGEIFADGFAHFSSKQDVPVELDGWVAEKYQETTDCASCYYHKVDMRGKMPDHGSLGVEEALQYYECSGGDNDDYGLFIENSADGETEIYLTRTVALTSIAEYWPNAR
tara:strand:+ start:2237 stop:2875 length:639 start_codon:yes stop_codon:yes gene_type:complete